MPMRVFTDMKVNCGCHQDFGRDPERTRRRGFGSCFSELSFFYRIEFIKGMGRGFKRVVEAEEGRERRVEASHDHMKRGENGRGKGRAQEGKREASRKQEWESFFF